MITTIDLQAAKMLRAEVASALSAIAEKHGLKCNLGRATFTPEGGIVRVAAEFAVGSIGGVDRDRALFERDCRLVGLEPEDIGKVFQMRTGTFKVTGVSINRPRYPINGVSVPEGRMLKFPASVAAYVRKAPGPTEQ